MICTFQDQPSTTLIVFGGWELSAKLKLRHHTACSPLEPGHLYVPRSLAPSLSSFAGGKKTGVQKAVVTRQSVGRSVVRPWLVYDRKPFGRYFGRHTSQNFSRNVTVTYSSFW